MPQNVHYNAYFNIGCVQCTHNGQEDIFSNFHSPIRSLCYSMKSQPTHDQLGSSSASQSKKKSADKAQSKVLNLDALDQSLWLVKVPQFVAERWANAENDDILGSLTVTAVKSSIPNKPPIKQLNIKLNDAKIGQGPDAFTLEELKSSNDNFFAFSTDKDANKGFSVDGKVTKNMVLKPQINEGYRQLIRARGLSNVANRKEIGVANMQEIERTSTQSHTVEFITSDRMELKRKAAAEKALSGGKSSRTSLSGLASSSSAGTEDGDSVMTALRSRVFQAFETNERLTFKDIFTACADVPGFTKEKDLRDLLELYGKYNHRGMYKTFWELKPEYRDHSATQQTSEG